MVAQRSFIFYRVSPQSGLSPTSLSDAGSVACSPPTDPAQDKQRVENVTIFTFLELNL